MENLDLESQLRKEIKRLQRELTIEKETGWDVLGKAERERQRLLERIKQLEEQPWLKATW